MDKIDSLNQVAEFHRTFKHPVLEKPTIPSKDRCSLRVSLLSEEVAELQVAIENNDLIEIADALCDIQYVLSGAVLEFGLGQKFKPLFDEVQRSNMSKACTTEEEAVETVAFYERQGTECYYTQVDDKFLVYRKGDNKTLKSINYSPVNLEAIISKA